MVEKTCFDSLQEIKKKVVIVIFLLFVIYLTKTMPRRIFHIFILVLFMSSRTSRQIYNGLNNVTDPTNRTENQMLTLIRRVENISDDIRSFNQRLDHILDAVQEIRVLYNNNSQVNQQQKAPTLRQLVVTVDLFLT